MLHQAPGLNDLWVLLWRRGRPHSRGCEKMHMSKYLFLCFPVELLVLFSIQQNTYKDLHCLWSCTFTVNSCFNFIGLRVCYFKGFFLSSDSLIIYWMKWNNIVCNIRLNQYQNLKIIITAKWLQCWINRDFCVCRHMLTRSIQTVIFRKIR